MNIRVVFFCDVAWPAFQSPHYEQFSVIFGHLAVSGSSSDNCLIFKYSKHSQSLLSADNAFSVLYVL